MLVENLNGKKYVKLIQKGVKTLYEDYKTGEYVVGSYETERNGKIEWVWGHYFKTIEPALEYLNK